MAIAGSLTYDTEIDKSGFESGLDSLKSSTSSAGNSIKSIVAGLGITKIVSAAFSTITGSVDGAISRLDTLNNYPKVMQNLGFSAEEAEASMDKLSESINGLPTALDDIVSNTQQMALSLGDLDQATDLTIALNDAILTFGGSTEDVTNDITQLNQMISSGTYDQQSWLSVNSSAPGLLDKVSQAILGETASQSDLRDALNDGTVSTEEFLQTFITLDQEGSESVTAFSESVKDATGGIGTAITNFKTRVTKGVADIIDKFDEALQQNGFGSLEEIISNAGTKFKEVLDAFADKIPSIINLLQELAPYIISITTLVTTFKTALAIQKTIKSVRTAFTALNTTLAANPIALVVAAIAALVAGFLYLWNTSESFRNFWIGLWNKIKSTFQTAWNTISTFFTETIPEAFQELKDKISDVVDSIISFFTETIPNAFTNFVTVTIPSFIQSIITWFSNLPYQIGYQIGLILGNIFQLGQNIREWVTVDLPEIIQSIIDWFAQLPDRIKEWFDNVINNIAEWGQNVYDTASTWISDTVDAVVNWFQQLPGRVWTWLQNTITKVKTWASDLAKRGKEAAQDLFDNIVNTIKELPSKMLEIGKNIVEGLWNGIQNAKDWIVGKVQSFASGILDGMKSALGINSPSTLFRDEIGKFIPQGVAVGIEADTDTALAAIDNMNDEIMDEMNKAVYTETGAINANANVKSNNSSLNVIQASFNIEGNVEMNEQKVGRLVTPYVSKTIKQGGIS